MTKLSELSKPVAVIEESKSPLLLNGYQFKWLGPENPDIPFNMYSQEYVSALTQHIAELEAKLATPVRLPNKNDDEFWFGSTFQVAKFDRAVERAISAAGFKFVGEE